VRSRAGEELGGGLWIESSPEANPNPNPNTHHVNYPLLACDPAGAPSDHALISWQARLPRTMFHSLELRKRRPITFVCISTSLSSGREYGGHSDVCPRLGGRDGLRRGWWGGEGGVLFVSAAAQSTVTDYSSTRVPNLCRHKSAKSLALRLALRCLVNHGRSGALGRRKAR